MELEEHDDTNCVICYYATNNCLAPCKHSFCEKCIEKWYKKSGRITCPLCTNKLASFNASQDLISNADFILYAKPGQHLGITLRSWTIMKGVKVIGLDANDIAYKSGIKKGMVITSINNIPVTDHTSAIKICEASKDTYGLVTIKILKPESKCKQRKSCRKICQELIHMVGCRWRSL